MAQEQKQGVYITQEDIDAALKAAPQPEMSAGVDDAKPLFLDETDIVGPGGGDAGDDEYFGLLSQEDIEALLHGDLDGSSGQNVQDEIDTLFQDNNSEDNTPSDAETVSPGQKSTAQEDVEQLMQAAADGGALETEEPDDAGVASDDAVSQDDIDRLLMKALDDGEDEPGDDGGSESAETDAPESGGVLSQDDLDQLLAGASQDGAADAAPEQAGTDSGEPGEMLSQDDLDQLLAGASQDGAAGAAPRQAETDSGEPGEMLSQDDLDRLLAGASENDEQDLESDSSQAASTAPDAEASDGADDANGLISQDDLDQLFAGASADGPQGVEPEISETASNEPEAPDDTESLIPQSELDELMGAASAGGAQDAPSDDADESEHISQDDINRLLKESLDEAEDPLDVDADADDDSDLQEPVILAAEEPPPQASPEPEPAPAGEVRKKPRKGGPKKRVQRIQRKHMVLAAAVAGIVLTVSVAAVMISSGPTETRPLPQPQAQVLTFSLDPSEPELPDTPVRSDTSVHLQGFVVFAPPNAATVTYVAADLTLILSEAAMATVIKENEALVRNIIYGTIRNELMTRDIYAIDEISLEQAIRKALGQIMARDAIGRIAFDRFQLV